MLTNATGIDDASMFVCNRIIRENLVSSSSKQDKEPKKPDYNEDTEEKQKRSMS